MAYLLDTDCTIDALGGKRNADEIIAGLLPDGVAVSWISVGQIIADFDILIAATALHHDLTLLTRNTRHFDRISVTSQ